MPTYCGNSSVGRAQPCQGWGREFESRFPLFVKSAGTKSSCRFAFVGRCKRKCAVALAWVWFGSRILVYIALVVHGSQFEVRLQLATVVEDGVDGKERGLSGDERTLLHQVGQSPSDLNDFIAAQVGQIAGREHHPRMDAAEHIAERLLYFVVRERSAMFGAVSCDGGKVHAAKIRHVFHRCGYYKGLRRGRPQPRLLRFNRLHDAGVEIRVKFYGKKFLALKLG